MKLLTEEGEKGYYRTTKKKSRFQVSETEALNHNYSWYGTWNELVFGY
jgi:hypothetical protein